MGGSFKRLVHPSRPFTGDGSGAGPRRSGYAEPGAQVGICYLRRGSGERRGRCESHVPSRSGVAGVGIRKTLPLAPPALVVLGAGAETRLGWETVAWIA